MLFVRRYSLIALALGLILIAPPQVVSQAKSSRSPRPHNNLVWPPPPQRARVRYVGDITSVESVTGRRPNKWLKRLAGVTTQGPPLQLQTPYGVVVDSRGRIFAADSSNRIVFVFDRAASKVEFRGDEAPAQFALPVGLAIDADDRLFVSDAFFHQVNCFGPNGDLLAVFGQKELQRPGGMALDTRRKRLYVADAKGNRVAVFDATTFSLLRYIGEPSKPGEPRPGTFAAPTNIAVASDGTIYVTDTWNNRVQVFDAEGKFLRSFGGQGVRPGEFIRPKGIAVDSEGHLYVADAEFNNFQILDSEGRPLLAVGSYGVGSGQFALIAGIFIDSHNRIYVTDQLRGRVQIFEYLPERNAGSSTPTPSGRGAGTGLE
jgi:DNA-binding beta-propeller fold protein YncE